MKVVGTIKNIEVDIDPCDFFAKLIKDFGIRNNDFSRYRLGEENGEAVIFEKYPISSHGSGQWGDFVAYRGKDVEVYCALKTLSDYYQPKTKESISNETNYQKVKKL